jgi:hypothetical protein
MEFYKSDRIYATNGLKYTGLTVLAGDTGKVYETKPDVISIMWDKDKRQLARLTPPVSIMKESVFSYGDFKKRAYFNEIIIAEIISLGKFYAGDVESAKSVIDYSIQEGSSDAIQNLINRLVPTLTDPEMYTPEDKKVIMNYVSEKDERVYRTLVGALSEKGVQVKEDGSITTSACFNIKNIKIAQGVNSRAREFMSEEDYDNFKKLISLRSLYSEENINRQMEGLGNTKSKIKDLNEKIDAILEKYKDEIMDEFDGVAKAEKIDRLVKKAKKKPWAEPKMKGRSKGESKSIDTSKTEEQEIENVKPGESNVLDYGHDPLAVDNTSIQ